MTATPVPTLPLVLATGDDTGAAALIRLHAAGIFTLTDAELGTIRQADALGRAAAAAGVAYTAADNAQSDVRARAIGALSTQAKAAGTVDLAAIDGYVAHLAELPALKLRYSVLGEAAGNAARHAVAAIHEWVRRDDVRARLVAALDAILDESEAPARIMADAARFSYTDPGALYRADKPVQGAFGALVPIAGRHDLLRSSVVALWSRLPVALRSDPPVELHGAGVVQTVRQSDAGRVWTYAPAGHPVQRLVEAVLARDTAEEAEAA